MIFQCFRILGDRNNLTNLAGWEGSKPYTPPCAVALDLCAVGLIKGQARIGTMFAHIVWKFRTSMMPETSSADTSSTLAASVLTHSARNGLGIINLVDSVGEQLRLGWGKIAEKSYYNVTQASWEIIRDFYETYLTKNALRICYSWARIIDHGYLRGLATKEHLALAVILAEVQSRQQGAGVWDAQWATDSNAFLIELSVTWSRNV